MRLIPRRSGRRTSTVAGGLRNACVAGLALVAFSAPPAFALSVFDIIQLSKQAYSDQAIIDLIDATGSAFELEAEDLPKLQELGVSEPVIRTMLERRAPEGWDSGEAVAADASHRAGEDPEDEPGSSHADVAGSKPHGHVRPAPAPQPDGP